MSVWRAARHTWQMMNPWRPVVRDHRGRKVPLYRFDSSWRYLGGTSELAAERFGRIRAKLLKVTRRGMGGSPPILIAIVLLYTGLLVFDRRLGAPWAVVWPMGVMIAMFLLSAITYRYRVPKADREVVVDAMLSEGLCASCAYDLSSAQPDAEGLTKCSECGAAWVMPAPTPQTEDLPKLPPPRVEDHRGQPFRLLTIHRPSLAFLDKGLPVAAAQALRGRLARLGFDQYNSSVQSDACIILLPNLPLLFLALCVPAWAGVPMLLAPWVAYLIGARMARQRILARAHEVIHACLAERLCPCCGYSLTANGAPGELITCPECGAVWDISRHDAPPSQ